MSKALDDLINNVNVRAKKDNMVILTAIEALNLNREIAQLRSRVQELEAKDHQNRDLSRKYQKLKEKADKLEKEKKDEKEKGKDK